MTRIVRHDESPLESCLRDRGWDDVADELGARHAYTGRGAGGVASVRSEIRDTQFGWISKVCEPDGLSGVGFAQTAGIYDGAAVGLRNGDSVTGVVLWLTTLAAGVAPTLMKVALLDKTAKVLAQSANLAADGIWTNNGHGFGPIQVPFSGVVSAPGDDIYYACLLQVGAWGTTQPQFLKTGELAEKTTFGKQHAHIGSAVGGLLDFPANGGTQAFTGPAASQLWAGVY